MPTVLLVDDDVDLVASNKAVLIHRGYSVKVAHSGADARAILQAGAPDIMVLDIMMETHTAGFELAVELKDNHPGLPVIVLSGVNEIPSDAFKFLMDESWVPVAKFINKPVRPSDLADHVDRMLKRTR
jgi:DNA-binding NtrC family response regulator